MRYIQSIVVRINQFLPVSKVSLETNAVEAVEAVVVVRHSHGT